MLGSTLTAIVNIFGHGKIDSIGLSSLFPLPERKAAKKTPVQDEQDKAGASLDHESVEEAVKSTDAEGENSNITTPADALNVEIEYPLFQTTEILEFEPDFPQPQSPQPQSNGQSIHEGIESDTEPTQFGDGDGESISKVKPCRQFRCFHRPRPVAVAKTPKPKRPVQQARVQPWLSSVKVTV